MNSNVATQIIADLCKVYTNCGSVYQAIIRTHVWMLFCFEYILQMMGLRVDEDNSQGHGVSPLTIIEEPMSSALENWVLGVESTTLGQVQMVVSAPGSPQSSFCASNPREEMGVEHPISRVLSCFVADENYAEPLSFCKEAPEPGFAEEFMSNGVKEPQCKIGRTVPRKRRATPGPLSGLKNMDVFPSEVEQERIFNMSVPLLKKERGNERSSKKRARLISGIVEESSVPSVLWTPPEISKLSFIGTTDPLAVERAELRKRKVWMLIGSLVQTLGGTAMPDKK